MANWSPGTKDRQIVSPVAAFDLNGQVEDDLPMDRYMWQTVLNDGPVHEKTFEIPAIRSTPVSIRWDMLRNRGNDKTNGLPPGSQLKTRLIAIDRAGNRAASDWKHVFIGGTDYDPSRHNLLRQYRLLTRQTYAVVEDLAKLSREIHKSTDQELDDAEIGTLKALGPEWLRRILDLRSQWNELSDVDQNQSFQSDPPNTTVASWVSQSSDSIEVERWVFIDRFVSRSMAELSDQVDSMSQTSTNFESGEPIFDNRIIRRLSNQAALTAKTSTAVGELAQWMLSIELAAGLMQDLLSIESDIALLADENSTVPIERLPGQADLLIERLNQVGNLARLMNPDLPAKFVRHQENLQRHVGELTTRIDQANEKLQLEQNPDVEREFRTAMREINIEIRSRLIRVLLNGDAYPQVASKTRELNKREFQPHSSIDSLREIHVQWEKATDERDDNDSQLDTTKLRQETLTESLHQNAYENTRNTVSDLYARVKTMERLRPDSIVKAASDWNLIRDTLDVITDKNFVNQTDKIYSVSDPLKVVTDAASILESGHQIFRLVQQIQDIADRERYGDNIPDAAIRQRARLEHYQVVSETPLLILREGGVDADAIEDLQNARWDKDFQQARQRMVNRNGDSIPSITATDPVQSLVIRHQKHTEVIENAMRQARSQLRQFLPTTGELARSASEEASKQASSERDELKLKVDALLKNLADRANTANYRDDAQRELAKDADAAIGKIGELMDRVTNGELPEDQGGVSTATAPKEDLESLANLLRKTAEHFDAADVGTPLESTREALRENSPSNETQDAARSAEATNDAANASPDELLERLEEQLERDEAMQTELAEITKRTASAVEEVARSIAKQEQILRQDIEKADVQTSERKRELRNQLRSLSEQARAVNDHWLGMSEQVSGWKEDWPTQQTIRKVGEELRRAIEESNQVQNDEALISNLESAAGKLKNSLDEAASALQSIQQTAEKDSKNQVYNNEKARQQKARKLESAQRKVQNRWLQSLAERVKDWKRRVDESDRRTLANEKEYRNAEKQLNQAEQHLKKHSEAEWAERGVRESRRRLDEASIAIEQSKQTQQAAKNAVQAASKRLDQERKNSVRDLHANDPTSELLARVAEKSRQELARLSENLEDVAELSELGQSLSPSPKRVEGIATEQTQANDTIRQASEDLRRVSRHERRLGNSEAASELAKAADQLSEVVDDSMEQATDSLNELSEQNSSQDKAQANATALAASEQLGRASEQLRSSADRLSVIQQTSNSQPMTLSESDGDDSTGTVSDANRSEKLARTLDELDRGLQASRQSQNSNQGQPTAGQSSPTLAATARQAIRELAAKRQQQVQQITKAGQKNEQPNSSQHTQQSSSNSSGRDFDDNPFGELGKPGNQSGDGHGMSNGEPFDARSQTRVDGQWGSLRERRNDDGVQDRKATLPPAYRPAIEAYFQAISAEAARSSSSSDRQERP